MAYSEPARTTIYRTRIRWLRVAGVLLLISAIAAALAHELPTSPSPSSTAGSPVHLPRSERRAPLGEADGAVPYGTTVFDGGVPGVAHLHSDLLAALRRAATDAAGAGVEFLVDSGWRSRAYQEQLFHDAVSRYGSEAAAARWVATPATPSHVPGDAVDT